jgi:hypothetical protein
MSHGSDCGFACDLTLWAGTPNQMASVRPDMVSEPTPHMGHDIHGFRTQRAAKLELPTSLPRQIEMSPSRVDQGQW